MTKKREAVDDLLDSLVWMRRKSKKHEPVDDLIDALVKMRRETVKKSKKASKRKRTDGKQAKKAAEPPKVKRT
jgi:hypothetical protein